MSASNVPLTCGLTLLTLLTLYSESYLEKKDWSLYALVCPPVLAYEKVHCEHVSAVSERLL